MKSIATLTLNPAIDTAYGVDRVFHTHKMRTLGEHYDPGGGGINVARVIARLGGIARAHYLSGGATGAALDNLIDAQGIVRSRIPIEGNTRISIAIYEEESGKEYRFVPPGPVVLEEEWRQCLDHIAGIDCDYLVVSGSLPPGVPDDFYARVREIAARNDISVALDSSGAALKHGLSGGGILLVKPSQGELQAYAGRPLPTPEALAEAAAEIVAGGHARYVAVTLGHEGALLADASGILRLPAIPVEARSAVGAGDSFMAAMIFALASDWAVEDAFRYGIAAGAAAVLTPGTELCERSDVERLYATIRRPRQ